MKLALTLAACIATHTGSADFLSSLRRVRSPATSLSMAASTGSEGPTSIGSQWPPTTHTSCPRRSSSAPPSLSRLALICGNVAGFHCSA
jgi:hypothetical protein